ncbi:MAG: patatin-like phospholipase family protein [Defluviitaleaceae bacterium]|nr:patatin-like phospholipase family protein [Defluviitaleaceae bacterium]
MKRIGLALSGGGIRAAIFHLGVLCGLAEAGQFGKIASISSVSGASLCIGLIFAANGNKWPDGGTFLKKILPRAKELILEENIQRAALRRLPFAPHKWNHRVLMLADMLEKKWGIAGDLQDLPQFPFWEINCTTFETGGRFRFRRDYMGDEKIGYVQRPKFPISHMIAASAAFPVLIGPYVLKTDGLSFSRAKRGVDSAGAVSEANVSRVGEDMCRNLRVPSTPDAASHNEKAALRRKYSLWDGGVYDNLGLDALHKIGRGLDGEIDFLIVSNAGAPLDFATHGRPSKNLRRLLDISSAQVDRLRTRDFLASVVRKGHGLYLRISENYPTTLNSPSQADFDRIFRDGRESVRAVQD